MAHAEKFENGFIVRLAPLTMLGHDGVHTSTKPKVFSSLAEAELEAQKNNAENLRIKNEITAMPKSSFVTEVAHHRNLWWESIYRGSDGIAILPGEEVK